MRDCRALRAQLLAGAEPRWLKTHKRRRYVTAVALSIPTWVDWDHIKRIHAWKRLLSVAMGVEHVVDHIVPLNHPHVCGLTVPWNLQVTTRLQNGAKGNSFSPDQLELELCTPSVARPPLSKLPSLLGPGPTPDDLVNSGILSVTSLV